MPTPTRRTRKTAATAPAATTDETATPAPDETANTATDPAPAATPDETTPAADPAAPVATDTADNETTGDAGSDTPAEAPVSGAPVSGAPVGSGDHLKIVMVAGILGDHPDGVTAATIADESGLRAAIVGRVLAAMETAGAAVRKPAASGDDESGASGDDKSGASGDDKSDASGVELWVRGEADLTTVDLSAAAVRVVCPTCNRPMPCRNTVNVTRTGPAAPGQNSDGSRTLGKNELRNIVRDFLVAHPGHEFTPTTLSREIGRSSGATANALAKLVVSGEAVLVREAPATFTAPETAAAPATAGM